MVERFFRQLPTFSSMDEWTNLLEDVFNESKLKVSGLHPGTWVKTNGLEVLYKQQVMIEFQQVKQFLNLAARDIEEFEILDSFSLKFIKHLGLIDVKKSYSSLINSTCESLELFFTNFRKYLKLLFSLTQRFKRRDVKWIISGISPSEAPTSDISSDFSWLVRQGYLEKKETLYILPSDMPLTERLNGMNVIKERELLALLPLKRKLSALPKIYAYMRLMLAGSLEDKFFVSKNFFEFYIWLQLLFQIRPRVIINSLSRGWPEDIAIGAAHKAGVRTVLWFYGSGEYYYSNRQNYPDNNIRFSHVLSEVIWVWTEEIKRQFEGRQFYLGNKSCFKVSGPMMNGDFKILEKGRLFLRSQFKIKENDFLISVFDLTPHRPNYQINAGMGPYVNKKMIEEFYEYAKRLLDIDPRVKLLVKPKRAESIVFEEIECFQKLLEVESRVILCPFNINPYIPIGASDFVLSAMITSPSILAEKMGVPSAYLNTTGTKGIVSPNFPKGLITQSFEELKEKILESLNNRKPIEFSQFINTLDSFLKSEINSYQALKPPSIR